MGDVVAGTMRRMNKNAYSLLAALAIIGSVILALAGTGAADDQLAIALLGLAGTLAGRGSNRTSSGDDSALTETVEE